MPRRSSSPLLGGERVDIGSDTLTDVNGAEYMPPFALTAKLNQLTLGLNRPQLSPKDIEELEAGMKIAAAGTV